MKTKDQLIAHCEKVLNEIWQYVFGAKGAVLSIQQIKQKQDRWVTDCVYDDDVKYKDGKICCDYSGLISSLTGVERNSQGYYDNATEKKDINLRDSTMRGWSVQKKGHISIYDGNDEYYAMENSNDNMVHRNLSSNKFTHFIKLCDINYNC